MHVNKNPHIQILSLSSTKLNSGTKTVYLPVAKNHTYEYYSIIFSDKNFIWTVLVTKDRKILQKKKLEDIQIVSSRLPGIWCLTTIRRSWRKYRSGNLRANMVYRIYRQCSENFTCITCLILIMSLSIKTVHYPHPRDEETRAWEDWLIQSQILNGPVEIESKATVPAELVLWVNVYEITRQQWLCLVKGLWTVFPACC